MKKIIYYIIVFVVCIIGLPVMICFPKKWNKFGRRIDAFFQIDSPHTKNYKKINTEKN